MKCTCKCKICGDEPFKDIVDVRIGDDGTMMVKLDCGHERYFKLEEIEEPRK